MLITKHPKDLISLFNKEGSIFAYPTEAVFGLGCNPDDELAVKRILDVKQRSIKKGLILIAADFSQVQKYLRPITQDQKKYTLASETTYIFPSRESAPKWLTGDFNSLAIRITAHPIAKELCNTLHSAIVSTSANITGQIPAKTTHEVKHQLGDKIDAILDGKTGNLEKPTVIRDSISGQIIRS